MVVERKAAEDQQKADGGAAGILEEDADGEGESAKDENSRHNWISRAAVGTIHVRLGFAKAEEGDNGEAVKNPRREDEEVGEFFEGAGQRHQACQRTLKNQRATRSQEFGMDAVGDFEKNFIASHRVGNARAAEDRRIERADGGNNHSESDPDGGPAAGNVFDNIRRDV